MEKSTKDKKQQQKNLIITKDNIRELQKEFSVVVRRRVNNGNTKPLYRLEKELFIQLLKGNPYVNEVINIKEGFIWDLSSVPRPLWGLLPPDGDFELASLIHDYLYIYKQVSRKEADKEMLLWSKIISGTNNKISLRNIDNYVRYYAVRAFGWIYWNRRNKNNK